MDKYITTNRLKCELHLDELQTRYDVFLLTTSEKHLPSTTKIFDELLEDGTITILAVLTKQTDCSLAKGLYVLLLHNDENLSKLNMVRKNRKYDSISIKECRFSELPPYIVYNLLLCALHNFNTPSLQFSNLSGNLYVFRSKWQCKFKKDAHSAALYTLKVSVSQNMDLRLQVTTFSSLRYKNAITWGKRKLKDYPRYKLNGKNVLVRKLVSDDKEQEEFIIRSLNGFGKNEVPFLDLQSKEFPFTKVGVLATIVRQFNAKFEGMAKISFSQYAIHSSLAITSKEQKGLKDEFRALFLQNKLCVVNLLGEAEFTDYGDRFRKMMSEAWSIAEDSILLSSYPLPGYCNIVILHSKGHYAEKGMEDPYSRVSNDSILQHVVLENLDVKTRNGKESLSQSFFVALAHELQIKKDLRSAERKLTSFDWEELVGRKVRLFQKFGGNGDTPDRYFMMEVEADGSFSIQEVAYDPFASNDSNNYISLLNEGESDQLIIQDGVAYLIRDTEGFTLPDFEGLAKTIEDFVQSKNSGVGEVATKEPKLRGEKERDKYISSLLDIQFFKVDGEYYYVVGTIGAGMKPSITHATVIRKVSAWRSDGDGGLTPCESDGFKHLLPLMQVLFVRHGRMTVFPFLNKYVREFVGASL